MSFSGNGKHVDVNAFHVGPAYYYFQIISAKIFGNYPDKLAYPDLFWAILSLPLFYYFLRLYFERYLSLAITALYAISAYFIHYSRFAWSCNSIPFFVLLFLTALNKVLEQKRRVSWYWVIFLGLAWGIGVQLHALILVLFSTVIFIVFLYTLKSNHSLWKKWAAVFLIFLALNITQIISESKTDFRNTRAFFGFFSHDKEVSGRTSPNKLILAGNDADCQTEANFVFLTSFGYSAFGSNNCSYIFSRTISSGLSDSLDTEEEIILVAGLILSVAGYGLLIYNAKKESQGGPKHFSRLIILYCVTGFIIMAPISGGLISDLRYYNFGFFVPFVLLGIIIKFLKKTLPRQLAFSLTILVFLLPTVSNVSAISREAEVLRNQDATCTGSANLGELEQISNYLISRSAGRIPIGLSGDHNLDVTIDTLVYLIGNQHVQLEHFTGQSFSGSSPAYYLSCRPKMAKDYPYQEIGQVFVYQLN